MMSSIKCKKLHRSQVNSLVVPEFRFDLTATSAAYNWTIVKKYGSLFNVINAQDGTPMELGSVFLPIHILDNVFSHHPLWKDLYSGVKSGFNYPLIPLSNTDQKLDLQEALIFGNHKGVDKYRDFYLNLIKKDVVHGCYLPFTLSTIKSIPGAIVSPLNIAKKKHNQ